MNTPVYGTKEAIAFLNGVGADAMGRTVYDYLKFDAYKWEECHNHVQWAFPSHIASNFNPDAPVVDLYDFRNGLLAEGYTNLETLRNAFLASLGIFLEEGSFNKFVMNWDNYRAALWLTPRNHNYLRLTRLLNLMSVTDPDAAVNLLDCLLSVTIHANRSFLSAFGSVIDTDTVIFWSRAAIGKL